MNKILKFSTLLIALSLIACKPSSQAPETKVEAVDPNLVELSPALQKQVKLMTVGEAEIREILRIPGNIQVDE